MYKWLLCWRYLLTRYLALACVVSVMLGVGTLIVVNSVMSGFSTKLKDRLHGLLSDVLVEAISFEGFADPNEQMERIRKDPVLKDKIAAMTPTLEVFAMIQFRYMGETITKPIHLIGIDPKGRAEIGGFSEYLVNQKNQAAPSFQLSPEARQRHEERNPSLPVTAVPVVSDPLPGELPEPAPPPSSIKIPEGVIVGKAIASYRKPRLKPVDPVQEVYLLNPGDDVIITTISGKRLAPVYDRFTVCDFFKSEMSEYDANYVFVPLEHLQKLRTMENRVTSIQMKLNDYEKDKKEVETRLKLLFPDSAYMVETWEQKQGPILSAIAIERGILNVLLFMIIGVAGFGILAIFTMIVVEKTRDIGILKALGASNGGVMKIFLGYGLLLGLVGAALGTLLGLAFTENINEIEKLLSHITGQDIFDRSVYYFDKIPTNISTWSVTLVNVGAVLIAVLFSVLPALRAALLHPVRALRYE